MEKPFSPKTSERSPQSWSCFNIECGVPLSFPPPPPPNGWLLGSGQYSTLCEGCGRLYSNKTFCHTFHTDQQGWRNCNVCNNPIHCSCIVSINNFVFHDDGGVVCVNCNTKTSEINQNQIQNQKSPPHIPSSSIGYVERRPLLTWREDSHSKDKVSEAVPDRSILDDDVFVFLREALEAIENEDLGLIQEHKQVDPEKIATDQKHNRMIGPSNVIANVQSVHHIANKMNAFSGPVPHGSDGNRVRKHPGHRADCTCIVCRQPSKGNRHPEGCNCDVCDACRRRRETFRRNLHKKK